jgi:N-acetylneuraminate synthase/sialic acid synthase
MGACVIERHFTLNRAMKGNDHAASLGVPGLQKLVSYVRNYEEARGDGVKRVWDSERPVRKKLAKSLVSARPLKRGTKLALEDICFKGPGGGIGPNRLREYLGRVLVSDIGADQVLLEAHFGSSE